MKERYRQLSHGQASREAVLGLLVASYLLLSIIAYLDFPRHNSNEPLSELERTGLSIWRENNCQACHQIYGFGGFLGPDLTNRVTDQTPDQQLSRILTSGSRKMPAFNFSPADQSAVAAFLRAVNRTGRSQPQPLVARRPMSPIEQYRLLQQEWTAQTGGELDPETQAGQEIWHGKACAVCHVPLAVGLSGAPDLSRRTVDRSSEALHGVLDRGRGNMPPFALGDDEIEDLSAYLNWFSAHRAEFVVLNNRLTDREEFSWTRVPWFEYK